MATVLDKANEATPTGDDILYLINNPLGTPGDRNTTVAQLAASAAFGGVGGAAAPATDAVMFVSTAGSDANTGLSLGKAKLTIEAAYAALPATGGMIELGAGTFTLAAAGATTGLTIAPTKPCHFRGRGMFLSRIRYVGTGIGVRVSDGTASGYTASFVDCGVEATSTAAGVRVVQIDNAHRCYITRASIVGYGNTVGSVTLRMTDAFQTYIKDSVIYGNAKAVHMTATCNDSSIIDTSLDAGAGICLHIVNSDNIRLQGGQISGNGSNIGVQIDATGVNHHGYAIDSNTHFEGNGTDVIVGPAATSTFAIEGLHVLCPLPSGITLDRAVQPYVITSYVQTGKTITVTANCSGAFLFYSLNGGSLSDSGVKTNWFNASAGTGHLDLSTLTAAAKVTALSFLATNGAPAYDFNPAAASGTYLKSLVGVEANERFSMIYNGQMAWGPGGGTAVDVVLARLSSAVLGVTGKITASAGIGVGNSAAATTPGTVTKKMQVFDASGASLGYVAIYDAIT